MESKQLPDDELPVQLLESISNEASEVAKEKCSNRTYSYTKGYEDGYFIGATSYVEWKVKYDEERSERVHLGKENDLLTTKANELVAENEQLRRWKAEALTLLSQGDTYADKHHEIKLGQGKVEFTIARAKERDELKQGNERLKAKVNELMPMVEAMVYYSQIHTVRGVRSAEMPTHEIAWKSAQRWLWDNCKANKLGNYTLKEGESNIPAPGEGEKEVDNG